MCRIDDIGLFKILFQRRGLAYSTSKPDWFSISLGVSPLRVLGIWLRQACDALFTSLVLRPEAGVIITQ